MARPINALIIEDSYTTRRMIMTALNQAALADFAFTEADDGVDALGKFCPGETQIIFVDMNMPRMDGIEFLRELRSQHKKCPPAVMITGESAKERLLEALNEPGVDALLLKPVDRDRLREGLKTLVDGIPERLGPCAVPYGECVPQAVQQILDEACNLTINPEAADHSLRAGQIMLGMVTLHGAVHWSVVLGFTREASEAVASKFAGYDISSGDLEDLGDAIGEITNIVGGRVRTLLASKGKIVTVSLPTVVSAAEFQIVLRRKTAAYYVYFDSAAGKLWTAVTVGIHPGMVL
jgi:CheY-like chemotaxis protein